MTNLLLCLIDWLQLMAIPLHGINGVRQTEIHTSDPSSFEVEIAIKKVKRYISPGINQVPAEFIQAEGCVLRSTNLLILFRIRNNCQSSGRYLLLYLYIRRVIKWTVVIIKEYHCYQLHTFFQHFSINVNSICRWNYWGSSVWISK
jgi:hypothetical protein